MPKPTTPAQVPPHLSRCEFLASVFDTVTRLGVSAPVAEMICSEIHAEWAGQRTYIAISAGDEARDRNVRNEAIRRDHRRGESVALLARRYKLHRTQIHRIVSHPMV